MTPGVLTLDAAWALVGLLALPVLWWLHRRLARPPRVDVPSLLFFVEEPGPLLAAARRRRDLDLLLALVAATALALAAAGPVVAGATPGRSVRVVVAGGAPALQAGYHDRVNIEIARVRAALGENDELDAVTRGTEGPRPSFSALAAEARAGDPDLAVVISDVLPAEPPPDVRWVAVGDPRVKNVGIVAADLEPHENGFRLLVTMLNHASAPVSATLEIGDDRVALTLAPDEAKSVVRSIPSMRGSLDLRLSGVNGDVLSLDDRVELAAHAPRWAVDERLPAGHREAALAALRATLGMSVRIGLPGSLPDVDHWVLSPDAREPVTSRNLALEVVPPGSPGVAAPAGMEVSYDGLPVATGVDLVYPVHPSELIRTSPFMILWRKAERESWPVLKVLGETLLVAPDIMRGSPMPASTPFWPLLVEAIVRRFDGEAGIAGTWRQGLLDPASTRLGRVAKPFDPTWLAAVPPSERANERPLRPWLIALGLAALAGLWLARVRPFAAQGARSPGVAVSRVG